MSDDDDDGLDDTAPPIIPGLRVHTAVPAGGPTEEERARFRLDEQAERAARNRGETGTPERFVQEPGGGVRTADGAKLPSADPARGFDPEVARLMIEKFPAFNVGWKDPLKEKWFAAYAELMRLVKG